MRGPRSSRRPGSERQGRMNTGMFRNAAGAIAGAALMAAVAPPPAAAQQDLEERVYELEQELILLRRQLESQIRANAAAADAAAVAATEAAGRADEAAAASTAADDGPTVKMKGPAPTFSSADGDFTMSVTGRAHWDVGVYNEKTDGLELNDGSNLRRARLGVKGKIMKDWGYEIVLDGGDSAADDVDIDTAFVSWKGLKPLTLTLGQHKAPLTLEDRTSSNDIPFIERSLATNLFVGPAGGKRFGLSGVAHGDMWWVGAGLFGEKLGKDASTGSDEQWSWAGRIAFAPVREKGYGVHLGAGGWLLPEPQMVLEDEETGTYRNGPCRFRDRPEFRVDANRHIDAKGTSSENCYGVGGEFAAWFKPAWVAAEYTRFGFDEIGSDATTEESFDAWYLQAGWVLTGEGRPYSMRKAAWGGVKPTDPLGAGGAGTGALELVGRYSYANLDDETIMGGEETNYTLGLNWWLNNWVALKFNYIRVEAEKGSEQTEFDIFGLRAQVKW